MPPLPWLSMLPANHCKQDLWRRGRCSALPPESKVTSPPMSLSAKERSMTLSTPVSGRERDQLKDKLGKEGGNDRGQSRGQDYTKDQEPKDAHPRKAEKYFGKLARKNNLCKKPATHYCKSSIFRVL